MKRWEQILIASGLALAISFAVRTDSRASEEILNLKQTGADVESIAVTWNSAPEGKQYLIEISDDGKRWSSSGYYADTAAKIGKLQSGSSYYVRVTACDENRQASEIVSPALEVVTAPDGSDIKAVQSGAATGSVTARISGVKGANYYFLTRKAGGEDRVIGEAGREEVSSDASKYRLKPAKKYSFQAHAARVSASGYLAESAQSAEHVYLTLAKKIPKNRFGMTAGYGYINVFYFSVNWKGSVDGCQYQFQTLAGKKKKTVAVKSPTLRLEHFAEGRFYRYRVRTYVRVAGGRAYSGWSDFRYFGIPKKFSARQSPGRNAIQANWSAVSGAGGYDIYLSGKSSRGYQKVMSVGVEKRTALVGKAADGSLKPGKTYYIKVVPRAKSGGKAVVSDANWYCAVTVQASH